MDRPQRSPLFRTRHGRLAMTPPRLAPDDLLRCPHCHYWHPLVLRNGVSSTPYANDMLFWQCGKGSGFFYAGQLGGTSRFETRRPRTYRVGYHCLMPRKRERKPSKLRASSSGPPERPIHPNIHESLVQAIKNKNFVTLVMRDHREESGEPHVYGQRDGRRWCCSTTVRPIRCGS